MPSPHMSLSTSAMFSNKKTQSSLLAPGMPSSAASYLSALSKADAQARRSHNSTPPGTPALSMSSSITAESELEDPFSLANDTDSTDLMRPRTAPTSEQVFTTVHAEFGHCANQDYRYTSEHGPDDDLSHVDVEPPYYILLSTYAVSTVRAASATEADPPTELSPAHRHGPLARLRRQAFPPCGIQGLEGYQRESPPIA